MKNNEFHHGAPIKIVIAYNVLWDDKYEIIPVGAVPINEYIPIIILTGLMHFTLFGNEPRMTSLKINNIL